MTKPYTIIRNFISSERADSLGREYMDYCQLVDETGDILHTCSTHNYISFAELLYEKLPEVKELAGKSLFPTYAFSRVYKKGSILKSHTDRDECELSLTVHLCSDSDWNIWIEDDGKYFGSPGERHDIHLEPGDAMLYNGKKYRHGRTPEFDGTYYTQVFLHYVETRGIHSPVWKDYLTKINKSVHSWDSG